MLAKDFLSLRRGSTPGVRRPRSVPLASLFPDDPALQPDKDKPRPKPRAVTPTDPSDAPRKIRPPPRGHTPSTLRSPVPVALLRKPHRNVVAPVACDPDAPSWMGETGRAMAPAKGPLQAGALVPGPEAPGEGAPGEGASGEGETAKRLLPLLKPQRSATRRVVVVAPANPRHPATVGATSPPPELRPRMAKPRRQQRSPRSPRAQSPLERRVLPPGERDPHDRSVFDPGYQSDVRDLAEWPDLSTCTAANTTTGRVITTMHRSLQRIDKILTSLYRSQRVPSGATANIGLVEGALSAQAGMLEDSPLPSPRSARGRPGTDQNTEVAELKTIIEVLLRDVAKHKQAMASIAREEQRQQQVVTELLHAAAEAEAQTASLKAEVERLGRELRTARATIEDLQGNLVTMRRASHAAALAPEGDEAGLAMLANSTPLVVDLDPAESSRHEPDTPSSPDTGRPRSRSRAFVDAALALQDDHLLPAAYAEELRGTVAVVACGVQGAAGLLENFPAEMDVALGLEHDILLRCCRAHGGRLVKHRTAEELFVFPTAVAGCTFALDAQVELGRAVWPTALDASTDAALVEEEGLDAPLWSGLRVRMGIDAGAVEVEGDPTQPRLVEYIGRPVQHALILRRIAFGGMVAVSDTVAALVRHRGEDMGYPLLGPHTTLRSATETRAVHRMLPQEFASRGDDIARALASAAPNTEDQNAAQATDLELLLGRVQAEHTQFPPLPTADGMLEHDDLVPDTGADVLDDADLPSGRVAFLAARMADHRPAQAALDHQGFTSLTRRYGNILAAAVGQFGGQPFAAYPDPRGGAVQLFAFGSPNNAVLAALEADSRLLAEPWPRAVLDACPEQQWRGVPVFAGPKVAFGVHAAEGAAPYYDPMQRSVRYTGDAVLLAARLCEMANGGQMLLPEALGDGVSHAVQPRPLLVSFAVPQRPLPEEGPAPPSVPLCICVGRQLVGRCFLFNQMADHALWRRNAAYLSLREALKKHDARWAKRATLVLPCDHRRGEAAPTSDAAAADFATLTALQRHWATLLGRRAAAAGPEELLHAQLQTTEGAMMAMLDPAAMGTVPELAPVIADAASLRGLLSPPDADPEPMAALVRRRSGRLAKLRTAHDADSAAPFTVGRHRPSDPPKPDAPGDPKAEAAALRQEVSSVHQEVRHAFRVMDAMLSPDHPVRGPEAMAEVVRHHRGTRRRAAALDRRAHSDEGPDEGALSLGLSGEGVDDAWRALTSAALAAEAPKGGATYGPPELCRSILGHCCRHLEVLHELLRGSNAASRAPSPTASPAGSPLGTGRPSSRPSSRGGGGEAELLSATSVTSSDTGGLGMTLASLGTA